MTRPANLACGEGRNHQDGRAVKGHVVRFASFCAVVLICLTLCTNFALGNQIDIVFVLDDSGSISSTDFQFEKDGFAGSVADPSVIPQDGSVRIGVVAFSSSARIVLNPTTLTPASSASIYDSITGVWQSGGTTALHFGTSLASDLLSDSSALRRIILVATDGIPDSASSALSASDAAVAAGVTEIDGIGIGPSCDMGFLGNYVRPQPNDSTGPGFAEYAADFPTFLDVVRQVIASVVDVDKSGLFFEPIGQVQNVKVPFTIVVEARNDDGDLLTGLDGLVTLSSDMAAVDPNQVQLVAGQGTTDVELDSAGTGATLRAAGLGFSGRSNPFDVFGTGATTGHVAGLAERTIVTTVAPVSGAQIKIAGNGGEYVGVTGANGRVEIADVPCGLYNGWAEIDTNASDIQEVAVPCGQTVTADFMIDFADSCDPTGRTPVLVIPGIMGSSTGFDIHPTLPKHSPAWNDSEWPGWRRASQAGLHQVARIPYWTGLVGELTNRDANYYPGCMVFPVPYDWRISLDDAVDRFLRPQIAYARSRTGAEQVHVVAHSMGGLLTRAYIESDKYDDDIDLFVMLGTPNQGSPVAYFIWAGGDPVLADEIQDTFKNEFYSETILAAYKTFFDGAEPPIGVFNLAIQDFVHDHVPSLRQLLPAGYPYLLRNGQLEEPVCWGNPWLSDLNSAFRVGMLEAVNGIALGFGNLQQTLEFIVVGERDCSRQIYPDGRPNEWWNPDESGDGTVPASATSIPGFAFSETWPLDDNHAGLVGEARIDVADFLLGPSSKVDRDLPLKEETTTSPELRLTVDGRFAIEVVSPSGSVSGVQYPGGALQDDIENSSVRVRPKHSELAVENPESGLWRIRLFGPHTEDFGLGVGVVSPSGSIQTFRKTAYSYSGTAQGLIEFTIPVETEEPTAYIIPHVAEVTDVGVEPSSPGVILSFTVPDPAVNGARVYARSPGDSKFEPILNVPGPLATGAQSMAIGEVWATDEESRRIYAVAARSPPATTCTTEITYPCEYRASESFLSGFVTNDDRDHDGIIDWEEAAHGTSPDDWDSDGDGVSDGSEISGGWDPLDPYSGPNLFISGDDFESGDTSAWSETVGGSGKITPIIDSSGDGVGNPLTKPSGIAVDGSENVYVAGFYSSNAFKITPGGVITEIIDSSGDGTGNNLFIPSDVTLDGSGNVYVSASSSDNAFKITPGGVITEIIDSSGDGMGNTLDSPWGIAVDGSGNVYVTGSRTDNAFKITPGGVITQVIDSSGDGAGNTLDQALDVAVDGSGNVYVTGGTSYNAFKVTPGGVVTEIIDSSGDGSGNFLFFPGGIAVDGAGNVYLTGIASDNAFKITPGGVITEVIDSSGDGAGHMLDEALGVAVDGSENVYVTGGTSDNAFKITPGGVITEIIKSSGDGAGNTLSQPLGIAVGGSGNVFVAGAESDNAFKIVP